MPLISVIVPMYNVERFLPDCLESVRRQSLGDFECICVDDGSPDHCKEIVRNYQDKDPRFRLICQENQGLSGARNTGIDAASGEYLFFVDSDDFLHARAFECQYNLARENNADYVCARFRSVDEGSDCNEFMDAPMNTNGVSPLVSSAPLIDWLDGVFDCGVSAWMRLYKRDLFDGVRFMPDMKIHEDTYICPLILARSKKAVLTPEVLYYYRERKGSLMRSESYSKSLTNLARNADLGAKLASNLGLSRERTEALLGHCGMTCFAMVAMDLILNVSLPREERLRLLEETRILFRSLEKKRFFKYSMVIGVPTKIALFVSFALKRPWLFRIFYSMVWPRQWRKRLDSARFASIA